MNPRWRITLLVTALLATSVVLAQPVAAQKGGPGLFPAGTYRLSFAGASYSGFANNVQIFLNVGADSEVARPEGTAQTATSETVVGLSLYDYNTFTFTYACLKLDHPSDFTIDKSLGSASLNTTLSPSTPSCPYSSPLTTTLGISATWTGIGPLAHSTGVSNYTCAGYNANSNGQSLANTATANFTMTSGGNATTFPQSQAPLNSDGFQVEAHGALDPGCGPTGYGIGPMPAGHYRFNGLFANGFSLPPTGYNAFGLYENNQSAQAGGGPAASSSEFDLYLTFFGGSINGFGCFAIPQSDVLSNGLNSASVQATVTGNPICTNSYPGFGLNFPLNVTATWTGKGPLMVVHDQNNFQCLGYSEATSTFVETRAADSAATVTMPDYSGNPATLNVTGDFGSLTQVTQQVQANGVLPQACMARG